MAAPTVAGLSPSPSRGRVVLVGVARRQESSALDTPLLVLTIPHLADSGHGISDTSWRAGLSSTIETV